MKKLFAAIMIAMFAITLTACGNGEDPEDIVDCTVTPEDPSCEVDCTVTPEDPACDVECDAGYEEVDGECELIDPRSAEEIAADLIEDNWDGTMEHADMLMEYMDFSDAMTMITEFNVDVTDGEGIPHVVNLMITDEIEHGEYDVIKRTVTGEFEEEEIEFVLLIEETMTGFIVYYDTAFLRSILELEDTSGEVQDVLDTLDANGKWFMFKFDDSLANLVELEVLKEMVIAALYQELGDNFLTVIEDEINNALQVNLSTYGFMFEDFVEMIFEEDFAGAELMLENTDFELLVLDLDQIHLVPEVINHLTMYELDMLAIDPMWDLAAETQFLLTNGTQAWLEQLTETEIQNILSVHDPVLGEAYAAYLIDDLDHFIVMQFLNDPQVQLDLAEIPGLDVMAFTTTMDNLDYDAYYMELEMADLSGLFNAIYEGYEAYDIYVTDLAVTAPELASILGHFGGEMGLVDAVQEYMVYVDDIQLGFTNLIMFEEYFTPEYYLGIGLYDVALEITDEFQVIGTATVDTSASSVLVDDVLTDVYWYLDAFETFEMPYVDAFNCPDVLLEGEVCEVFEDYPEILANLGMLGEIVITVQYDPLNMDEVVYNIQYSDFVQELILIDNAEDLTVVNDFSITVTMLTEAAPVVPTEDITNVNEKVEDFAKFSLVMEAREILNNIEEYYMNFPMEEPTTPAHNPVMMLENYIGVSVAFDHEMSYFVVDGDDITLVLYWLDGTPVFTEALSMAELNVQFGEGTGVPDRIEFLYWMDKIVDENFNMTKLFLVYMWERYEEEYFPMF